MYEIIIYENRKDGKLESFTVHEESCLNAFDIKWVGDYYADDIEIIRFIQKGATLIITTKNPKVIP